MVTNRLGRGIDALIRPQSQQDISPAGITTIPITKIKKNPHQPRKNFDEKTLEELASSIKEKGVITPITVRLDGNGYILIAGERRLRASRLIKRKKIPAYIIELTNESEMMEVALIENIQRQDLSVIDEAQGYANLLEINSYTQDQLSEIIGKSRSHIANLLRLLGLPKTVQSMLRDGALTMGQARPLIGHPQAELLAKTIVAKGLSARQAEALMKTAENGETPAAKQSATTEKQADIKAIEQRAAVKLGLAMSINWN